MKKLDNIHIPTAQDELHAWKRVFFSISMICTTLALLIYFLQNDFYGFTFVLSIAISTLAMALLPQTTNSKVRVQELSEEDLYANLCEENRARDVELNKRFDALIKENRQNALNQASVMEREIRKYQGQAEAFNSLELYLVDQIVKIDEREEEQREKQEERTSYL